MLLHNLTTRPRILTLLCIGSAFNGLLWIIMLMAIIVYSITGIIPSGLFPRIPLEYMNAGYWFMIAEIVLNAFGMAGVWMMWQKNMDLKLRGKPKMWL